MPDALGQPVPGVRRELHGRLDGIRNQIEPPEPIDKDLYELPPDEADEIPQVPGSLEAVLDALEEDNEFLQAGGVFTPDLIDDLDRLQVRPTRSTRSRCARTRTSSSSTSTSDGRNL